MWYCTSCRAAVMPPKRECPGCYKPTKIASHLALAGEDEADLRKRHAKLQSGLGEATKDLSAAEKVIANNLSVSINMDPASYLSLLAHHNAAHPNLHDVLNAELKLNYDPYSAAKRTGVDNLIFGNEGERLHFGALNLGNSSAGVFSYGAICAFLRLDRIADRLSFTESNSFTYVKRQLPAVHLYVPPGVRALYHTVSLLAGIKHYKQLIGRSAWLVDAIVDTLIHCRGNKQTDRFIEAQVLRPITIDDIESVVYYEPASKQLGSIADDIIKLSAQLDRDFLQEVSLEALYLQQQSNQARIPFKVIQAKATSRKEVLDGRC